MKRGELAFLILVVPLVLSGAAAVLALLAALGMLVPAAALPLAMLLLASALLVTLAWIMRHDRMEEHRQTHMARLIASMQQRLARLEREINALLEVPRPHPRMQSADRDARSGKLSPREGSHIINTKPADSRQSANDSRAETHRTSSHSRAAGRSSSSHGRHLEPGTVHASSAAAAQAQQAQTAQESRQKAPKVALAPSHEAAAETTATMRDGSPNGIVQGVFPHAEGNADTQTGPWLKDFRLYLEPIIDRHAKRTDMYRALPALARDDAHVHLGKEAQLVARNGGYSGALDVHVIGAAAAFLRKLKDHGQALPVIAALSEDLFFLRDARKILSEALTGAADVRTHLVLEVPQKALASMGNGGVLLLAWLAGLGVRLSLGDADPQHMDAHALATLGFTWMDMALPVLKAAPAGTLPLQGEIEIIVSGISAPAQAAGLPSRVRLVRGRLYAPPRRLKEEILGQALIPAPTLFGHEDAGKPPGIAPFSDALARGAA